MGPKFVQTAADYTAIMYILGVGDRHDDNLMVKRNGSFFHIDFGCIFGNGPAISRLCATRLPMSPQMITAMGGLNGTNLKAFKKRFLETIERLKLYVSQITKVEGLSRDQKLFINEKVRSCLDDATLDDMLQEVCASKRKMFHNLLSCRSGASCRKALQYAGIAVSGIVAAYSSGIFGRRRLCCQDQPPPKLDKISVDGLWKPPTPGPASHFRCLANHAPKHD